MSDDREQLAVIDTELAKLDAEEKTLLLGHGAVATAFGLRWPKDYEPPQEVDERLSAISERHGVLFAARWELRKKLKLDPRTGKPPVKAAPMQTVDEGWFPGLLGPISELSECERETDIRSIRTGNPHIVHEACRSNSFHLIRFVAEEGDDRAISGLSLRAGRRWNNEQSAVIKEVFTDENYRRQGYAAKLLEYARTHFRKVEHSKDLTAMGREWKRTVRNPETPQETLLKVGHQEASRERRVDAALAALPDGHTIEDTFRGKKRTWTKITTGGSSFWLDPKGRGFTGSQMLKEIGHKIIEQHIPKSEMRWEENSSEEDVDADAYVYIATLLNPSKKLPKFYSVMWDIKKSQVNIIDPIDAADEGEFDVVGVGYFDDPVGQTGCLRTHTPKGVVEKGAGQGFLLYSGLALTAGYASLLTDDEATERGLQEAQEVGGLCVSSPVGGRSQLAERWWKDQVERGFAEVVEGDENCDQESSRRDRCVDVEGVDVETIATANDFLEKCQEEDDTCSEVQEVSGEVGGSMCGRVKYTFCTKGKPVNILKTEEVISSGYVVHMNEKLEEKFAAEWRLPKPAALAAATLDNVKSSTLMRYLAALVKQEGGTTRQVQKFFDFFTEDEKREFEKKAAKPLVMADWKQNPCSCEQNPCSCGMNPTYPDGRKVPEEGDRVYQMSRGFGGAPARVMGVVERQTRGRGKGAIRVRLTGGATAHGAAPVQGEGKFYALDAAWTAVDDPEVARREKAREGERQTKATARQREEDESAAAIRAGQAKYGTMRASDVRIGDTIQHLGNDALVYRVTDIAPSSSADRPEPEVYGLMADEDPSSAGGFVGDIAEFRKMSHGASANPEKAPGWVTNLVKSSEFRKRIVSQVSKLFPEGESIDWSKMLGCGHYGCAFAFKSGRWVLKITRDPTEGPMQAMVGKRQEVGDYGFEGFAIVRGVFRLEPNISFRGKTWPVYAIVREEVTPFLDLWSIHGRAMIEGAPRLSPNTDARLVARALSGLQSYQIESRRFVAFKTEHMKDMALENMRNALNNISDGFPYVGQIMEVLEAEGTPLLDVHAGNVGVRTQRGMTGDGGDDGLGMVVIFDPGHTPTGEEGEKVEKGIPRVNG